MISGVTEQVQRQQRAIGPIGTAARIVAAAGLLYLGLGDGLDRRELLLGLVVFPGTLLTWQALRTRRTARPVRATGPLGLLVNAAVFAILLIMSPLTADAAALFYGASMVLAAVRGYAGCEVLAISNWLLRRDDQVGCLVFSPIDAVERRVRKE